ncbi:hypothetical protein ES708_21268 [subsurface metagenome]
MGANAEEPWNYSSCGLTAFLNVIMSNPLTPIQARQAYVHYLAAANRHYIGYMEWKKLLDIEVISTPYVKKLIKATGYPGHSELEDIYDWINNQIAIIGQDIDNVRDRIRDAISDLFQVSFISFKDIYNILLNAINTITGVLQTIETSILTALYNIGGWIANLMRNWTDIISELIITTSQWIADIALHITSEIQYTIREVGFYLGDMYQQFSEAIKVIADSSNKRLISLGDILIAAIKGVVDLAVAIVDGLVAVINTVVISTEILLTNLINKIVETVDILVTGVKDIVVGTINTMLDYFRWLWGEITGLLDKMFDFDVDNLAPLFVSLFEAQKKAFAMLKERAETVQP